MDRREELMETEFQRTAILYTADEVLHYVHSVIEDCALIVCPVPHKEEECRCAKVATQIRKLKKQWKGTGFVLRTTDDNNLFKRRGQLMKKAARSAEEESELAGLFQSIRELRTIHDPELALTASLITQAGSLLSNAETKKIEKAVIRRIVDQLKDLHMYVPGTCEICEYITELEQEITDADK